jgi:5-methylcytosine-specific restriction endonuclease McrA
MANPRVVPMPFLFPTFDEDLTELWGVPYAYDGFCPLDGDVVEREGISVIYRWWHDDPEYPEYAPNGYHAAVAPDGHLFLNAATGNGEMERTMVGQFDPDGGHTPLYSPFDLNGVECRWRRELIRAVTRDGREYDWEATVCVPTASLHPGSMWSRSFTELSERKRRISSSTARHARRVRVEAATTERFDPRDVFDRDGWLCALCRMPIDRDLVWLDPMSVSVDHVLALVAGGEHSPENTQAAHWICNVRKGVRVNGSALGRQ